MVAENRHLSRGVEAVDGQSTARGEEGGAVVWSSVCDRGGGVWSCMCLWVCVCCVGAPDGVRAEQPAWRGRRGQCHAGGVGRGKGRGGVQLECITDGGWRNECGSVTQEGLDEARDEVKGRAGEGGRVAGWQTG